MAFKKSVALVSFFVVCSMFGGYSVSAQTLEDEQVEAFEDAFSETETLNALNAQISSLQQSIIAQGGEIDESGTVIVSPTGEAEEEEVEKEFIYNPDNTPFARVPMPPRVFNNVGRNR